MLSFIKNNYKKILTISLISALSIMLISYILYFCKCLLNSDSAFIVDYSLEQIRTKAFFVKNWNNTNDFWVYSLIPLITVFIKLGCNLFMARQFPVMIQSFLLIILVYNLYKKGMNNKSGGIFSVILILTGISGQVLFELYGDATYGTIVFYMLLCLYLFIRYHTTEKKKYLIFFSIILILISACSLRFPIYIGGPLICVSIYFILEDTKYKKNFIAIGTICLSVIIGFILYKYLQSKYIVVTNFPENLIEDYEHLNKNFSTTVFNYLWLNGATNLNVYSLGTYYYNDFIDVNSPLVVILFIKSIFAINALIVPFLLSKKIKKMEVSEKIMYLYTVSFIIIMLFFLIIGSMSWWYRYLTPIIVMLYLLFPLQYKYLISNKKYKIAYKILIGLFVMCTIFLNTASVYDYKYNELRENPKQELTEILLSKGLTFGYTNEYEERNIFNLLSNGKLMVNNAPQKGKRVFWLNSREWYSTDYYNGKVFFMRWSKTPALEVEQIAIEHYYISSYDWEVFVFNSNEEFLNELLKNF